MTPTVAGSAACVRDSIVDGWELCSTPPGQCAAPPDVDRWAADRWIAATRPGTVAAILRGNGAWRLDDAPRRFDADDWWYRVSFDVSAGDKGDRLHLGFDGLAGVAEVWLNGQALLQANNMFVAYEQALEGLARVGSNTLHLRFASLDAALTARRARPHWRAPMVEHQQLRWFRTTLLGRTPGWSPPAAAVGLWKDVWIEWRAGPRIQLLGLQVRLTEAGVGEVVLACSIESATGQPVERVELEIERGGVRHRTTLSRRATGDAAFEGLLQVAAPALWWPHTHGEPALYAARLLVYELGGETPIALPLRAIGFRSLVVETAGDGFSVHVNGVPIFCRGACWMPLDVVSLRASAPAYKEAVSQARAAGMNMLRVSGATVYEEDAFFDACDAQGMLVWQDFMFANMDYPQADPDFMATVRNEVEQQLSRWRGRPSVALVCGNSEVEQQAAMWGAPRELWRPVLFHTVLRQWVQSLLPGVPYWPSSTHGGAFPHQSSAGTSSYYGVGAYLRPVHDARRADVRFASECLAFANVPESSTIARMPGGHALRVQHPQWKARAPRDLGAGWDFEDVRDHYLAALFGVDPLRCRYADHERYLALSRVVTGELMAGAMAEWRQPGSRCGGALIWFLRDLWAGAGWGLIDDAGVPKACYYYLRRASQPLAVSVSDEGGNGLVAHVVNERDAPLQGELHIRLFDQGDVLIAKSSQVMQVPGRGACSVDLAACFDGFLDLSYAYRFGPPPATVVHVCLAVPGQAEAAEAFFFPTGLTSTVDADVGLHAQLEPMPDGAVVVVLQTRAFAQSVQIEIKGYLAEDNYFHMAPGAHRRVVARPVGTGVSAPVTGSVSALNAARSIAVRTPS